MGFIIRIGKDFSTSNYSKTYVIPISETQIEIDMISIIDDKIPETEEFFSLSLDREQDHLNIFVSTVTTEITITDNDGRGELVS